MSEIHTSSSGSVVVSWNQAAQQYDDSLDFINREAEESVNRLCEKINQITTLVHSHLIFKTDEKEKILEECLNSKSVKDFDPLSKELQAQLDVLRNTINTDLTVLAQECEKEAASVCPNSTHQKIQEWLRLSKSFKEKVQGYPDKEIGAFIPRLLFGKNGNALVVWDSFKV